MKWVNGGRLLYKVRGKRISAGASFVMDEPSSDVGVRQLGFPVDRLSRGTYLSRGWSDRLVRVGIALQAVRFQGMDVS